MVGKAKCALGGPVYSQRTTGILAELCRSVGEHVIMRGRIMVATAELRGQTIPWIKVESGANPSSG
eukprot:6678328-Alexandrium_andersonii.AAC.1